MEVSDLHSLKTLEPICLTPDRLTVLSEVHPSKIESEPNTSEFMVTVVKDVQPKNAFMPTELTVDGMVTEISPVPSNADTPILVMFVTSMEVSDLHPLKAFEPIAVASLIETCCNPEP